MALNRKLLLLIAVVSSAVAGPVAQRGQCARYCTDESDFVLKQGSTHIYDYETTTVTTVLGSSQDKTQLQLTAQADIEVLSKCELSLRLRGVTLKLSDPESPDYLVSLKGAREFARAIEKQTLRFSFQNGQVEHVCPSENAPVWVTNIHKGVLSAFQTYVVKPDWTTRTVETDILGKCTAEYHSLGRSWQGAHTIRKTKDLTSCSDRENVETYFQGTPYSEDFQTQSLPVMKGTQECEQVIGDKFLQTSTCHEKLFFRPFSNRGNGVLTTVSQKLIYATTSGRRFTGNDYRPTTEPLLYSHAQAEVSSSKVEEETELTLKSLCEASKDEISIDVPKIFSAFVYKLKKMPFRALKTFYQKTESICPENPKARKFFMDAIPLVSTTASARFMFEMITSKAISNAESSFWLTSLSFITETSPEIISTFTPLLDGRFDQAILGVSALVRNYCNGKDCSNIPEVLNAVNKLAANLGENCFTQDEKTVILSLKALGNIGYLFGKESVMKSCYKNPQIRTEARLAAIEVFRRASCDISRDDLMKTYSNYNEDTEIRIAAYLAVMRCPSHDIVEAVKDVLMNEKINHVGSFIWTHLNALSKTKHPERQEIKEIVSNLYLMNKYASDIRKFSNAHEASFFLESIDSGIHVDSHLIFSTDSYLPRSAMFNLTVDVFGKSCNLFQINGRMEGLEHVVEKFFGPGGYFPQKNVAKILREKRSVDNGKLSAIDNQFQQHFKNQQKPYGSLDLKVFGTSMWYSQFRPHDDGTPDINLLDIVTKLAEETEHEYSRSFTFLDTTFTVPMTSGLPLKVALNGTASVALKIGGKFEVKSFDHVDVLGHIEPSGAIEISGLLTVEAGNIARSGMRIISAMHSSSVLNGKLKVRNGEVIKAQLNMPKDRIDVFNFRSKMYLVHGMEEREKTNSQNEGTHLESCTGNSISKIFGIKLCSELELPPYRANAPLHPLNGPARFNVFVQKTDPKLKSYTFDAQWKNEVKNGGLVKHGVLAMNTPGSQVDRDVQMEFYLSQADQTATLKIKTPIKKLDVNAKISDTDAQKKLDFALAIDDKEYFSVQSELGMSFEKNAESYRTSLEVRIPSRRLVAVAGSAELRDGLKNTVQLMVEDLTEKPILAKVNWEVGRQDRYDIEMSLNSFALDGTMKGYAQLGDSMSSRLTADYRILEGRMNKLNIIGKVRNLSASSLTKYTGLLNIQASVLPEWNTELSFETMKTTGHLENTISIALGDGARSRVHKIKIQEILRYEGSLTNNKVDGSLSIVYPEKNIDYAMSVKHENTDHSLKNDMQLQYGPNKQINTDVQLKMSTGNLLSMSGDVKLRYPGRDAAIQAEVSQANNKEYRVAASCQWQTGRKVGAIVNYKDKCEGSRQKYEVDGSLTTPDSSAITFATIVGYHGGKFTGSAEVKRGVDKYRAMLDYTIGPGINHRMAGQLINQNDVYAVEAALNHAKEKVNAHVELKMPNNHRVTAKIEGITGESLKVASIETYWDADRDTSKRFILNGKFYTVKEGFESRVTMDVLRRSIKGSLSTSLQGTLFSSQWKTDNKFEIEWSPIDKISGILSSHVILDKSRQQVNSHFEIVTPFTGYENSTVDVTHLYTNQQWGSDFSVTLPRNNYATISSNGKYSFARGGSAIESSARVSTSYRGFEELSLTVAQDLNSRELSQKSELKWGLGKRIFYQITGVKQPSLLKGSIKINTPFENLQEFNTEVTHAYTSDNYRTRGSVQWAPSKKVTFSTEGNHELSGRRRICTVSFAGTSPFYNFEKTGMKVTYSNDGSSVSSDLEMTWSAKNKIAASVSVSKRNQLSYKNIEGKFTLTSPFRNYENVQVSTSFEMNENSYKANVDTHLPYRTTASLNSQGKMLDLNDIELNVVLIGNIPKVMVSKRASIDFVHKLQNLKMRSTVDAAYGKDRVTILLIGLTEKGYNFRNTELSATINTPLNGYEDLKLDFAHNQRGHEYFSKLQMHKNKVGGSLTHKLNVRNAFNFDTTLELTSTTTLPNTKISIAQESNGRQFEHKSYVSWGKNNNIHLNAQYLDKAIMKEIVLKVTTPFQGYSELDFKASMECQDWDHKGLVAIIWNRQNKMTFGADVKNYRWESFNSQLEFTSSFRGYEFYSTSVKYDLTAPTKEAEISFLWDVRNRKSVVVKGNVIYSKQLSNLDLTLTTPFTDFNRIGLSARYENAAPERSVTIHYERGQRKISFTAKTINRNNGAEVNVNFNSPYLAVRDIGASAKYSKVRDGMKGEVEFRQNSDNYKATAKYNMDSNSGKGSVEVFTPIKNYEKINVIATGSYLDSKATSDLSISWGRNKRLALNGNLHRTNNMGELNINFQSTFKNYESVTLGSQYHIRSGHLKAEAKAVLGAEYSYEGSFEGTYGGQHLAEVQMALNTPVSPMKNVQLTLSIDSTPELYQLMSALKWEDKEANIHLLLNRKLGELYEAKAKLDTPFEGFRLLSLDSSLRNSRQYMDGRLTIKTPFEILRNLDAYGEYKTGSLHFVRVKVDTPTKNVEIVGKLANEQFQPLTVSLEVTAPFANFKKVSANLEMQIFDRNDAKIKLDIESSTFSHSLNAQFSLNADQMKLETVVDSSSIPSKKFSFSSTVDVAVSNQMSSETVMEIFGKMSKLSTLYQTSRGNMNIELQMESPFTPIKSLGMKGKLTLTRGGKEGLIELIVPKSTHRITAKYENKGNKISMYTKIESNLLPFKTLESQAKFINSNNRDIEASFSVSTPRSVHSMVGTMKNYEGEKIVQLKVDCPNVEFLHPFTVDGTLKDNNQNAMDVTLSMSTPKKELRIAGNMKHEGWQNLEAFLTVNTPFDSLRMVRVDGKFNMDRSNNIDCNFQIEAPNSNVEPLEVTYKQSRSEGSDEVALKLRLPIRNYRSMQLLGNVHYNTDYSSADSRVTLTIPGGKYVAYGQYGMSRSRLSGRGEIEVNNVKWSATGRLEHSSEKKDVSVSVSTPSSQTYTVGGAYGVSGNRRHLAATYTSPSNERYALNATGSFDGLNNQAFDFQTETPFANYRNMHGSFQHLLSSNYLSTNAEFTLNGQRSFLKVSNRIQRDGVKGSVQLGSPFSELRDVKLSYNRAKKHLNIEDSLELHYNRAKQLKMELIQFGEKSSHVVLDLPVFPLTITANNKKLDSGREIDFRSNYFSRIVSFRTSHQWEPRQILHEAAFSWDERNERRVSYDFKLSSDANSRELWTRVDTPLRSLMLKGNFTKTYRSQSGGVDFYWDASNSMEKHAAFGMMIADLSTNKQTSHKLELVLEHPKLAKAITQTNVITYTPSEVHLKSSLLYSRDRNHNLEMNLRAVDMSKSKRESQYMAEFSLKHPASRLDLLAAAEVIDAKLESSAHFRVTSLDRYQTLFVREVRAKFMKLRQEIELLMRSNTEQMSVSGRLNGRNGEYDIALDSKTNEQTDVTCNIKFSRRNRALDISVMNPENTGVQISASYPKESASLKLSHKNKGNEVNDATIYLGLEQSKILKSKLNWRPKLWEDLRINTGESLRAIARSGSKTYSTWASNVAEECSSRISMITQEMSDGLAPFVADMKKGVAEIERDLKTANNEFWNMYQRNEFHMKDTVKEIKNMKRMAREIANNLMLGCQVLCTITFEQLEDMYDRAYYAYLDFVDYAMKRHAEFLLKAGKSLENVRAAMVRGMTSCGKKMWAAIEYSYGKVQKWTDKMVVKFDKWLRSYAPCIIDGYYMTKHAADKIRYSINGITSAVSDCILSNSYVNALKLYGMSVVNTFKALQEYEYTESAQAFMKRIYDAQLLGTILEHPTVDYMSDLANSALRKSVEVYHNLGMDDIVSNAVESASVYVKAKAMDLAQDYLAEFYQSKAGIKYDFAPERGIINLELSLPAPRNSLVEVFEFNTYPEYKKMMDLNSMAQSYYDDFCVWDIYYKVKKYFTPSYWLPVFSAHAMLSGNQHFITFDKLSYDFAGKCSYLLARDFVDGNFTVIVNYGTDNHMRKSLTILVDKKKVDIGNDYRVTLDDTRTELPIQIGRTVMLREGSNIRVENEKKGFSVVCNFVHNYCSVSLSGFYFGKTAGLFGTFNYEPSLDMMSPSRYVMRDVESFAKSWEVGTAVCQSSDNFAALPSRDHSVKQKCRNLFEKSTSEFRACFKQVDPETYLNMCISDLSAVHGNDQENALCQSAAAYFVECKMEGVPLRMPKHCVRCEKQDGTYMKEGDAIQFPRDGTVTAADVVFLVEEKGCNRDRVRYLPKLAQGIEDGFKQSGYQDVRYSVVGFGGDRVHAEPHIHTMDGRESGPLRSLESALQSLEFGDGPVNILQAMRFAASLTYRPGTTKSFIVVKCSTCKSEEVKAEYSEMLRTLLDGDITLHLLMEQKYETKGPNKNSKARRVIGVDKKFAYTLKDVKDSNLNGDGDLLAQLKIPKDVCVPLAFEVNGSSFDAHFLTDTKKHTNKKFMDVLARLVVRSSSAGTTDWGMCCECIATEHGVGKSVCQRCVSAEMASMISSDLSPVYSQARTTESRNAPKRRVRKHKGHNPLP